MSDAQTTAKADFRPHAIILTERRIPDPIWLAAVLGVERLLRVELEGPEESYVEQIQQTIRQRLATWHNQKLPAFGAPTGFVVNYAIDRAVKFDLGGEVQEVLSSAHRVGRADFSHSAFLANRVGRAHMIYATRDLTAVRQALEAVENASVLQGIFIALWRSHRLSTLHSTPSMCH